MEDTYLTLMYIIRECFNDDHDYFITIQSIISSAYCLIISDLIINFEENTEVIQVCLN